MTAECELICGLKIWIHSQSLQVPLRANMEVILKSTHIWHSIIKCIYTTSSISWTSFYGYPDVTARYVKWMEVVDSAFFQRWQVEFVVYSFINISGIGRQRQTCGGWWEKCSVVHLRRASGRFFVICQQQFSYLYGCLSVSQSQVLVVAVSDE